MRYNFITGGFFFSLKLPRVNLQSSMHKERGEKKINKTSRKKEIFSLRSNISIYTIKVRYDCVGRSKRGEEKKTING